MESPYTLLTLPKPLDTRNGRVQSAPAITLRSSKKRKRHEITVGIDGESVNVYNIQDQSLQCAYAIPPQTYLCCPPASYHSTTPDSKAAQRDTFIVLRDGVSDTKRRLVRFTEKANATTEYAVPVRSEATLPSGEVLAVDVLPPSGLTENVSPQALVALEDGQVVCVAEDMSSIRWKQSIFSSEDKDTSLEHFSMQDVNSAKRGLLKGREDLVALLESSDDVSTTLACHIVRRPTSSILRISTISTGARAGLQRIDDLTLPTHPMPTTQSSTWHISAKVGQIFQLSNGTLYVYDLSGITPRLSLTLKERGAAITACMVLSDALVLVTTAHKAVIYDTKYGSVQGSTVFGAHFSDVGRKRKRDLESVESEQTPTLHWFPDTGLAIASTTDLIGMQVHADLYQTSRATSKHMRLSSVIGKSTATPLITDGEQNRHQRRREQWNVKLDDAIAKEDDRELDAFVLQEFNINREVDDSADNEVQNGDGEALWDLENGSFEFGAAQQSRALDLIRKMFSLEQNDDGSAALRLQIYTRNIVRWLFATDMLRPVDLSNVLDKTLSFKDIAQSLVEADPSFELVQDVLELSIHLPIQFSVECLRLLIRSLDTMPKVNGHLGENDAMDTAESVDMELDNEADVAEAELSNAIVTLQSGLETRSITMQLLFGRLHAFPKSALTKHLRQGLQVRDLVFFIHLLRIELADAGWTRPYVELGTDNDDRPHSEENGRLDEEVLPSDRAIRTIGNLLVAAVDAVGCAGWLVGLTTDEDEQAGLIDALHAEVSASLEGVYEAQALRVCLDEFERYSLSISDQMTDTVVKSGNIEVHVPTAIEKAVVMPLGGRSATVSAQDAIMKKGSKSMSARVARAKQLESMVGLYQFERIRV